MNSSIFTTVRTSTDFRPSARFESKTQLISKAEPPKGQKNPPEKKKFSKPTNLDEMNDSSSVRAVFVL